MPTAAQFQELSCLAWKCNGEAVCRTPLDRDQKALVAGGLAAAYADDEWTVLVLTPKGLRQLAS
jgi:alkylhydroperoxidase/carboxymuconolactone decarboxylase family protein YurZ